jgi:L-malate glycosyltransferase
VTREDVSALADAVVRLIRDRELNIKLGKNGRQHIVNNFSWQKNAEQMWALIRDVAYDTLN